MKKKTNWAKTKRYLPLYLMLLPGAAYLIINNYLPMAGLVPVSYTHLFFL